MLLLLFDIEFEPKASYIEVYTFTTELYPHSVLCIIFRKDRFCYVPFQAYCSILYLKPRMQIILRGQKVKTQLVSKSLAYIERDVYRPKFLVSFLYHAV